MARRGETAADPAGNRCRALLALVAAGTCGCGSSVEQSSPAPAPAPAHSFTSGSRLRANLLDGGEGAVLWRSWHDAALGPGDCAFGTASDGEIRCLPVLPEPAAHVTDTDTAFVDASCAQPIFIAPAGSAPPPLLVTVEAIVDVAPICGAGGRRHPVRPVGAAIAAPLLVYYHAGSTCTSTSAGSAYRYFKLGPELQPQQMVRASARNDPRGPSAAARTLDAEDGAQQIVGIVDRARGKTCETLDGDTGPCLPDQLAFAVANQFADAACTQPMAYGSSTTPHPTGLGCVPDVVVDFSVAPSTCTPGFTVAALGAAVPGGGFVKTGAACTPASASGHSNWRVGAPIATAAFPNVVLAGVGSGRLRAQTQALDAAHRFAGLPSTYSDAFRDTARGEACGRTALCDGSLRCVPEYSEFPVHYTTADCSGSEVVPFPFSTPVCVTVPAWVRVTRSDPGCKGRVDAVHALRAAGGPALLYFRDPKGNCLPASTSTYRQLGAALPPDAFAPLVERTE